MLNISKRNSGIVVPALLAGLPLIPLTAFNAHAQQTSGKPGSPGATMTIPGQQLPPPPQQFRGKIERNAAQSTPYWPARVVPPKDAPNILLIMTDDTGFGVSSTFGGVIPTPNLDRIAANGLRYTNFNSTALCSPTRAAIITGRNHHSMGFGVVAEQATGYPGYNSIMTRDKATIGRILKDNGYWTSWFGKDHNTPDFQASQAGPFDQWPVGMGFDYFYGLAAESIPQHHGDLPVLRQAGLEPDYGDGRRCHRIHETHHRDRPGATVLHLLRARCRPRAAPPDAGVDQEDQRHASV